MTVGKLRSLTADPALRACSAVRFFAADGTEMFVADAWVPEVERYEGESKADSMAGKPKAVPELVVTLGPRAVEG